MKPIPTKADDMKRYGSLIEELRKIFVSIEVFDLRISPVEKLVYGASGVILLGVLGAIVTFFVRANK